MATTTLTGTTGNDILNAPGSVTTLVAGFQGNDTIQLQLAADTANAGKGDDSITLTTVAAQNTINGGEGADSVFLTTAVTTLNGSVNFGGGADQLLNTRVQAIGGNVSGNAGSDTIRLAFGVLNSTVGGGTDNDSISIAGGTTNGYVTGGKGIDTLVIAGSASLSTLTGARGSDVILASASDGSSTFQISGGKGTDSIRLGTGVYATVAGGGLSDTINFTGKTNGGVIYGDAIGVTTVGTGTAGAADGGDLFLATKAFQAATTIYGGGGADTVTLSDTATTALLLVDAGNGHDLIGKSTVTFAKAVSGTQILGAAGNDTIKISGGDAKLTISGGAGSDSIYMKSNTKLFDVLGGADADQINVIGGIGKVAQVATIDGGAGADTIRIQNGLAGAVIKTVNTTTMANIKYGSGDVIMLTTKTNKISDSFTKANIGLAAPTFFIGTAISKISIIQTTALGSVAVFDTDGNAGTDGDLLIGITSNKGTVYSFINIVGGDELLTTTKVGAQALNTANLGITFTTTTGSKDLIMTLA